MQARAVRGVVECPVCRAVVAGTVRGGVCLVVGCSADLCVDEGV